RCEHLDSRGSGTRCLRRADHALICRRGGPLIASPIHPPRQGSARTPPAQQKKNPGGVRRPKATIANTYLFANDALWVVCDLRHRAQSREHAPLHPVGRPSLDQTQASALSGGMIALTDAGISCLIESAKVIEPRARYRWLQNLADELDPSPNARRRARWRRWYHNDKAGVATVRVRYSGVGLANLIVGGWLRERDEAYTDEEISKAIGSLIEYGNLPRKPNAVG